jgi:hypothetical protein
MRDIYLLLAVDVVSYGNNEPCSLFSLTCLCNEPNHARYNGCLEDRGNKLERRVGLVRKAMRRRADRSRKALFPARHVVDMRAPAQKIYRPRRVATRKLLRPCLFACPLMK